MTSYNKQYNCIFCNIPRTASSAMARVVTTASHNRLSALKNRLEKNKERALIKWDEVFKFCFVRNPYDRFKSAYYHLNFHKINDINAFLEERRIKDLQDMHLNLFVQQTYFILDEKGKVLVDFIGRYENLQKDWNFVCDKLGVKERRLRLMNESEKAKAELTARSKEKIYNYYKKDFEVLGYDK